MARYSRIVAAWLVASTALVPAMTAAPVAADGGTRQVQSSGTTVPVATATARVDGISARDAVHAAVMLNHDVESIASFDSRFDRVPGISRLKMS